MFKSVDFGITWQPVSNGLNSKTFRAIQSKGTTLFAGGGIGSGVSRSTDLGENWTALSNGLPIGSYRSFASDDDLIVAG
jgi:hypothetical protein